MPKSQPVVVHTESCEIEGWDDPVLGAVTWRTLLSGDRTPTAGLTVGVVDIGAGHGERSFPHRHAPAEVYFVLAGEGVVTIDGKAYPVHAGSAVFIPGNAWHATRNTGPEVLRMLYAFPVDAFADVHYEFPASAGDDATP